MSVCKGGLKLLLGAAFLFILASCGIDDYPYIYPIPQSDISQELNSRATVRISSNNMSSNFTHFVIFYRIYVSNIPETSTIRENFRVINPTLASDFNAIFPYIDSDTLVNINMDQLFRNRGYQYLSLDGNFNIDSVLGRSVLGNTLVFDFSSHKPPTMSIGASTYTLRRSNGNGLFSPQPGHRQFINSEPLWRTENINQNINADVVGHSGLGPLDNRFTFAALYIAGVGINESNYSTIYSTPSLIHVFLLPDQW